MSTMPHCDARILHPPHSCEYCDEYADWQEYRRLMRVAFTGEEPQPGWLPCPSTATRSIAVVYEWPGNLPKPPADTSWLKTSEAKDDIWMETDVPKWRWPWRGR